MQTPIYSNDLENWRVKRGVSERSVVTLREHANSPKFCDANPSKQKSITYIVENLSDARKFLLQYTNSVILTNQVGSTKYYGMLVLDYIFRKLVEEFPQVVGVIINVGSDRAALLTATKLHYKNIIYSGIPPKAKTNAT